MRDRGGDGRGRDCPYYIGLAWGRLRLQRGNLSRSLQLQAVHYNLIQIFWTESPWALNLILLNIHYTPINSVIIGALSQT